MAVQRYSVNQHPVSTLLTWINSGEIAIPEIQRPFVWTAAKVRDFIDSLYRGYPVGYLIAWRNPDVRLKDGTQSIGRRILIDGQQRVTALLVALLGKQVITRNYRRTRIRIAFHPGEERFEVVNAAISRDRSWITDISDIFAPEMKILQLLDNYCSSNPDSDRDLVYENLERLRGILNNFLGLIELNSDLDIETVAEIFIRINSQGAPLNAADFVMSKMAATERHNGHLLRKCIDYFCHLAVAPESYGDLTRDSDFSSTSYFKEMEWLKNEKDDLYDPSYTDMLRVAFTTKFKRARLQDLVALLSGRNFETREYEDTIAEESFLALSQGVRSYMNETNFKRFCMILRSAGFVDSSLIGSMNTINFAYILYLTLREHKEMPDRIESIVRRWYVMSVLTSRYTGSPETAFGVDISNIDRVGASDYLDAIEEASLSDAFWEAGLPQQMVTSSASSPYFNAFLASQVRQNDRGFLSRDITVRDLLEGKRDIHHIFPRNYLKKGGLGPSRYNQIANYAVMQSEINVAIGDSPPAEYFSLLSEQCQTVNTYYGGIKDFAQMCDNLESHCIPGGMKEAHLDWYEEFLQERRKLMAAKLKAYYDSL